MRIRKLLLVHSSRSTRALIQKYIFAEFSDIEIVEAENGRQALDQINAGAFDVIIFSEQLKDIDLNGFRSEQVTSALNGHTPLVVISERESAQAHDDLVRRGFKHVVQIRVRPSDLIKNINAVCDPRQWRKDARYHIPNVTAVILSPKIRIDTSLINISKGGVLVEFSTENPCVLMNQSLCLELQLSMLGNIFVLEDLRVKLLRVEAVAWNVKNVPSTMRATFIFTDLKSGVKSKLEELIHMAEEDKLAATQVMN